MKNINRQAGMTLIEMLVSLGISAVIIGGLGVAVYMIMNVTGRGNAEIAALQDLQRSSYWINNDARMARTTDLTDGANPENDVSLTWLDATDNPPSSRFYLSGTQLLRNYDGTVNVAAQHVSSAEFSIDSGVLTYTVVSAPPGRWQISRRITGYVNLRAYTGD
jgi:prepilin-type N-terminal cleavage/methylation domain-containing protein